MLNITFTNLYIMLLWSCVAIAHAQDSTRYTIRVRRTDTTTAIPFTAPPAPPAPRPPRMWHVRDISPCIANFADSDTMLLDSTIAVMYYTLDMTAIYPNRMHTTWFKTSPYFRLQHFNASQDSFVFISNMRIDTVMLPRRTLRTIQQTRGFVLPRQPNEPIRWQWLNLDSLYNARMPDGERSHHLARYEIQFYNDKKQIIYTNTVSDAELFDLQTIPTFVESVVIANIDARQRIPIVTRRRQPKGFAAKGKFYESKTTYPLPPLILTKTDIEALKNATPAQDCGN